MNVPGLFASQGCQRAASLQRSLPGIATHHRRPRCMAVPRAAAQRPGASKPPPSSTIEPADVVAALWDALSTAARAPPGELLKEATDAASSLAAKLQRYVEPPPPGFPPGPPTDQSAAMLADPLAAIESLAAAHGPVVGLLLGGERVVLVSGPAAARQVLIDDANIFVKEGTAFFPGSALTGNGLLTSDGGVWRRQRRLANPAFRRAAVEGYAAQMTAESKRLFGADGAFAAAAAAAKAAATAGGPPAGASRANGWASRAVPPVDNSAVVDVYEEFNRLTLNITLGALFGLSPDSSAGDGSSSSSSGSGSDTTAARVVAAVERAFAFLANRGAAAMVVPEWVPTPDNLEFAAAVKELDSIVYGIITRRRDALMTADAAAGSSAQGPAGNSALDSSSSSSSSSGEGESSGGGAAPSDLLQALLVAVDDDGSGLSDQQLRDEAMTLLVAGQETSAILLGWASALLAHHPAAQAAAAAEVAAALPGGTPPTASDVAKLPRVAAVVLEALRLFSPAYMVGRCALEDVTLAGGYKLPKGTTVLVSPYLLHRDPNCWEQPLRFDPNRWLPILQGPGAASSGYPFAAALKEMGPNGAYVPFGGGPRNCIGAGFAMVEGVLVLAALLQRYTLAPAPGGAFPRPNAALTLRPVGVPLRVALRQQPVAATTTV